MAIYPNGKVYDSPQEYYNDKDLDLDVIFSMLWRGVRTPQNEKEKAWKEELDEIKASGKEIELNFD